MPAPPLLYLPCTARFPLSCSYADADINALMRRSCVNTAGTLFLRPEYHGAITRVLLSVRQASPCVVQDRRTRRERVVTSH
jgi:hypothetical protein